MVAGTGVYVMTDPEPKPFERRLSPRVITDLQAEPLFLERLREDVAGAVRPKDRVFPAIRRDRVDFYYRGGRLFAYNHRGFRTHPKYAMAYEDGDVPRDDMGEADLAGLRPIRSFLTGYASMKKLCALYGGEEARQVAELSGRFSYAVPGNREMPVVVLDVEASFDARTRGDSDNDQDRIDLVLLNTRERSLMFVEAKLFTNPALRASEGVEPKIVAQIARYRSQVERQGSEILLAYEAYVMAANRLFGVSLPASTSVVPEVPLLIVGYDGDQNAGQMMKINQSLEQKGVRCLRIGKPSGATSNTLREWFRKVAGR
jgi:hypothetical protein